MNGNEPAFPLKGKFIACCGLTKREYFAAAAMQGIMASGIDNKWKCEDAILEAIRHADAALAAFREANPKEVRHE